MSEILLTMGMPVYNEEKYIGEAIESLLAQTFKNFVLIISDNASTDKTQQICEYYAKKDKRIVYTRRNENKGSMSNFRYVLEQAKTPYFMWCGGHDKWDPYFVEKLLPALDGRDIILSYCATRRIELNGTPGDVIQNNYDTSNIQKPTDRYLFILRKMTNLGCIFHGIWRTESLRSCDFDLKNIFADVVILEQAALEGKFKYNKEDLLWLRIVREEENHSQGIIRQSVTMTGKNLTKKMGTFSFKMLYISERIKILSRGRYSLNPVTKAWLTVNIIYFSFLYLFVLPGARAVFRKILSERVYSELKTAWHKR